MRSRTPSLSNPKTSSLAGFSLIEVTIALGIIAFALVTVVGLLPAGLSSQKQASQQARAAQVLNQISRSVQGVRKEGATQKFLPPLDGLAVSAGTSTSLGYFGNGTISAASAGNRLGTLNVALDNSLNMNNTLRAVISVAWPASAERSGDGWTKNEGSMETVLFINLPQ